MARASPTSLAVLQQLMNYRILLGLPKKRLRHTASVIAPPLPSPTTPEDWFEHEDYKEGCWMTVDIGLSK